MTSCSTGRLEGRQLTLCQIIIVHYIPANMTSSRLHWNAILLQDLNVDGSLNQDGQLYWNFACPQLEEVGVSYFSAISGVMHCAEEQIEGYTGMHPVQLGHVRLLVLPQSEEQTSDHCPIPPYACAATVSDKMQVIHHSVWHVGGCTSDHYCPLPPTCQSTSMNACMA